MYSRIKKLSKKMAVFAVALMMFCMPMSAEAAEAEIVVEPSTGTLYKGESVIIYYDKMESTYTKFQFRISYINEKGMNSNIELNTGDFNGMQIELFEKGKYKITNVSYPDGLKFDLKLYGFVDLSEYMSSSLGKTLSVVRFYASSKSRLQAEFSALLDDATSLVNYGITFMQSFLDFIVANPVILLAFIIVLCGLGIALLFRIIHSS